MFWNNRDATDFCRYVSKHYGVSESTVMKFLGIEYESLLDYHKPRKTKKNLESALQESLATCRAWLAEERRLLKPSDLDRFRISKLWFNSIIPTE